MLDRIYLGPPEKEIMQLMLRRGLGGRTEWWIPARLALARSLQLPDEPSAELYKPLSQQSRGRGVELHPPQLTGEGKGGALDLTDTFRAILSVYHGRDLSGDDEEFRDLLQRHVRRGLKTIKDEWDGESDFADYLLRELYGDAAISTRTADETGTELASRVSRVLGQLGIGASVAEMVDGPRLTRLTLELKALEDLDRLRRGLGKLAFALGYGESAITTSLAPGEQRVYIDVPRPETSWRFIGWREVRGALRSAEAEAMALPICVGTDVLGEPLVRDLAEAPHLFVGGTTGSGKSMCLHAILLSLLSSAEIPELLLIDPKAVEFSAYQQSRHLRSGGIITTADSTLVALEDLVGVMEERQERMRALDARNIDEANESGARLRRIVVLIDELGDLFLTRRDVEVPLIRLAQKARSSGIHLVLATQRPEAATFPGLLRSNIPSRIALTVQKAAESRIILDEQGAEALQGRGDMLIRFAGRPTVRAHGCRIDPSDISAAVEGA